MKAHIVLAVIGFATFVWMALLALAAEATKRTRDASTLLDWRREIASKHGLGAIERLGQHPASLAAQVWVLRVLTLAALCFTCWHIVSALIYE
ncbi:hypothetical protein [Paracoccus lutimaris]|uniref:Uncharacterized protein n=1 Tax=Paracoccus lutimaris TaxID=1490030 RepID=A0A368YKQ0_9RHOB|nr:hypothetical protein [Paracoccus lutimaris]RCW80813.1 hypothetical protein DFP89_11759 [Paracoccus lutimaris]